MRLGITAVLLACATTAACTTEATSKPSESAAPTAKSAAAVSTAASATPAATASPSAAAVAEVAALEVGPQVGKRIPAFQATAQSLDGDRSVALPVDSQSRPRTTVYMTLGVRCPATNAYHDRVQSLVTDYASRGVDFVFLYPNKTESGTEKAAYHKTLETSAPMIDDEGGKITKLLAGKKTSEAFITTATGKVLYRGGIDDNANNPGAVKERFLANALDEILAGKEPTVTTSPVFG